MAVHLKYISFRILVAASVWSMWKIAVVYIYKGDLNIVDEIGTSGGKFSGGRVVQL